MESSDIRFTLEIEAGIQKVFRQLTTAEGLKSFFAPEVNAEFRVGGIFEIIFNPEAPAGSRGAEGMRILSLEEPFHFGFTWNAPPSIPEIRNQRTSVYFDLSETEAGGCRLDFVNSGYGASSPWRRSYTYFTHAWGNIVLPRLKYSLEKGPVDWTDPPDPADLELRTPLKTDPLDPMLRLQDFPQASKGI